MSLLCFFNVLETAEPVQMHDALSWNEHAAEVLLDWAATP